jgi:hypothetical protein
MPSITFKKGSTPYTLHSYFMSGLSLTHDEAYELKKIRHLSQRVADLKKKFEEAGANSPLMVIEEQNEAGHKHARYFYAGCGCEYEFKDGARKY